jgi:hypothetical protein
MNVSPAIVGGNPALFAPRAFAALPHHIAANPAIQPVDIAVLVALLYFARAKPDCWPSDGTLGARVRRSVVTVQRSLRRLQGLGIIARTKDVTNRTGRRITLLWRAEPTSPVIDPPTSPVVDELKMEEGTIEAPANALALTGPASPVRGESKIPPATPRPVVRRATTQATRSVPPLPVVHARTPEPAWSTVAQVADGFAAWLARPVGDSLRMMAERRLASLISVNANPPSRDDGPPGHKS